MHSKLSRCGKCLNMKFYLQLFLLFCTGFVLAAPPRLLKNIKLSIHVVDGDDGSDDRGGSDAASRFAWRGFLAMVHRY